MTTEMLPPGSGAPQDTIDPASNTLARWVREHPLVVLSVVLLVLIIITTLVRPAYLSVNGLRASALYAAPVGILAASQTILMLTGGIDLSVAMVATGAAYAAASKSPEGAVIAIAFGLLVGLLSGATNGLGVGVFRVNPLIMTLAMSAILLGLFSAWAQTIFSGSTDVGPFIRTLGGGSINLAGVAVPWAVVTWAGISVLILLMLKRTGFGRILYALGDNPVAVRLAGGRSWQILLIAYTMAGVLAAVAGLLFAGRVGYVDLQLASQFLLPSVAAAVIGGTSIFGGVGTYAGTILGALILGVLNSLLNVLGTGQAVQQVVYGSIVLGLAWVYARVSGAQ